MKKLLPLVLAVWLFTTEYSFSQSSSELCQGNYYSEKEGARRLGQVQNSLYTLANWQNHADSARKQILKGLELEVFPQRSLLNPRFRNKKTLDGYTVEAVVFESLPGFFVTGNLYRPTGKQKDKSLAVILCPHGHWKKPEDYGRFRNDMQSRCAAFAKMGAIVFSFDLVGYGESTQLPHEYSKVLIFQTWNSIRIIDFLLSFPEADPNRVAVTGASGGGTQSIIIAAIDQRIKVSAPVVMVSAHFFGGCTCESGMPIHKSGSKVFSNAEIACLAAPRPLLLVSDGSDWTKNNPAVEFPFAKSVYTLYGTASLVENAHFQNGKHDYGLSKRLAVYSFFSKNLGLKIQSIRNNKGEVDESFVTFVPRNELEYFTPEEHASHIKGEAVYDIFLKQKVK